jgi:hypothetical protein
MTQNLVAPTFLFRFSVPCLRCAPGLLRETGSLGPAYRVPNFHAELGSGPSFADLRLGWHDAGLLLNLRVTGKKQQPWCRASRLEDSDGLSLWLDTRDTQTIHRANRFCHRLVFLPQGGGLRQAQPVAQVAAIHLAREHPKPVDETMLRVRSEKRVDGYLLRAVIPEQALTGYEPAEHARLGFYYAVVDRELGWQTFSLGAEYPFASDPSLWGSLELVS